MDKICRGQVWYIQMNDGAVGSEMKVGRPVVIVSSQERCERCERCGLVQGVYMTTVEKTYDNYVELFTPRRKSWAICDQIVTLDKSRLTTYMCKLTSDEMGRIEETICKVLGLNVESESGSDDELIRLRLENDLLKRTYQKAVEMLAEFKFVKDAPKVPEKKVEESTETPKVKVNVNTATWKELVDGVGISKTAALSVTGTRKRIGGFKRLEDLLKCDRFTLTHLNRYREMLEV